MRAACFSSSGGGLSTHSPGCRPPKADPPLPFEQTDRCKNITLPQTSFAGGKDVKEAGHYEWVLLVTELFNIAVNDFDAKKPARCGRVLVVTELVSGTQCIYPHFRDNTVTISSYVFQNISSSKWTPNKIISAAYLQSIL